MVLNKRVRFPGGGGVSGGKGYRSIKASSADQISSVFSVDDIGCFLIISSEM